MMTQVEYLKKYRLSIRGTIGQHLLIDPNVQRKIVASLPLGRKDKVLEIGPGLGALTSWILESGAVYRAIEKDKRFVDVLREEFKGKTAPDAFIHGDILKENLSPVFRLAAGEKMTVIGNLPYYITAPILFRLLDNRAVISKALVMVQKEVAERILAGPGTKDYGRMSLGIRYGAKVSRVMDVGPGCFTPRPAVDSSVLLLEFHDQTPLLPAEEKVFFQLVETAFSQRRKTFFSILSRQKKWKKTKEEWLNFFKEMNLPLNVRGEELMLKDYLALAKAIC